MCIPCGKEFQTKSSYNKHTKCCIVNSSNGLLSYDTDESENFQLSMVDFQFQKNENDHFSVAENTTNYVNDYSEDNVRLLPLDLMNVLENSVVNRGSTVEYSKNRKQKRRDAFEINVIMKEELENYEDDMSVIILKLKQAGIYKKIENVVKNKETHRAYESGIKLETRQHIWDFWHSVSTVSTLTSRPAKLRTSDRPKIQNDLTYHDTVKIIKNKRNVDLFQSPWMIFNKPVRDF